MPYTDPFDFITTRLEEPKDPTNVRDDISLLPLVPADNRISFDINPVQGTVTGQSKTNSLVESIAQGITQLPDNRPAYQYTTQQENRYSNPNLQFTPTNLFGTDTEDIYGRKQSGWKQLGNALVKTGANALGTFASSFLTTPATLDLIRSGHPIEAFSEDHLFSGVQDWLTALEDKFPNYYTQWERDHPYMSATPLSGGFTNFWGDKIIKNIGFSIGGLGAGLVQDALIELATSGTATPATFIALANQLGKFKSNMFRGFRELTKGASEIDNILDTAKLTGNLAKGLEISKLSQIGTGARYATISYLNAQGESFIEGYHTYLDTKKQLLESAIKEGNTSPENLSKIEQLSQDAGRYTTGLNIPILTLSNLIQFPNLLYGKSLLGKEIAKEFISTELTEEGLKAVNNFTLKKGLKEWALESFKDAASEGFEEGAQFHISNSLHDYYVDRMNPKIKQALGEYLVDNIPNSLTNKQFWEESILGGISGFLMGAPATLPGVIHGKERHDNIVNSLNNSFQRFNSTVSQFSKAIDLGNPTLTNADKEVSKHDALFSSVHDSLKFGTFDTFMDSLEDLKDIDLQKYNQTFQTDFETDEERNQSINDMMDESYKIRGDVLKSNRYFSKNPYTSSTLVRKIKDAFSPKSEIELNNIQENLFNDFREVIARNESLLRKTKGQVLQHKDNLKALGVKNESIEYMANLARSPKGVSSYLKFKQAQIKDLQRQVDYYQSLSQTDNTLTPEVNSNEELKNAQRLLEDTKKYVETIKDFQTKLSKNPKDEDLQKEMLGEILYEETTEDQRDRYIEERANTQESLEQSANQEENLEQENIDLHKGEESETAEQILETNQQAQEQGEILPERTPVPEPIVPENQWLDKYKVGHKIQKKGKFYTVVGKTEDAIIVQDELGINYKYSKDKTLIPLGPEGKSIPVSEENLIPVEEANKINAKYDAEVEALKSTTVEQQSVTTEEVVDEYLNKPVEEQEVITKVASTLTIGQEEFTKDEIISYPNTVWIKSTDSLVDSTPVYTVEKKGEDVIVRKRKLFGTIHPVEIGQRSGVFNGKLPNSTFKQVLRDEEIEVTKTIPQVKKDNLDKFLGENKDLKEIFQQQIDRGKFELIC